MRAPLLLLLLQAFVLFAGLAAFMRRRSLHLLRYFQQDEYDAARFWSWCRAQRAFDRKGSAVATSTAVGLALAALVFARPAVTLVIAAAGALGLAYRARSEVDPRVVGKKRLVMTARATRIHRSAQVLSATLSLGIVVPMCLAGPWGVALAWLAAVAAIQSAPLALMLANRLLGPFEKRIQDGFYREAKAQLAAVNPFVIGITGSYGKTSTKMILGELLGADAPTFWTARSINTVMGIAREVRERLAPHHKWAVVEMGAYGVGSIERLSAFTPPKAAIVTAVGVMHLERFGSVEAIYRAKSELARAVPDDGILVCNGDDAGARRMAREFRKATTLLYGFQGDDLDCKISNVKTTPEGSEFALTWKGMHYEGRTRLHGYPMLSNLMASFTMAAAFGLHPSVLLAMIRGLPPIENRLQVDAGPEVTWVHDAYNSNPAGFESALDVLAALPGHRRILVTPGMVELGPRQADENRKAAARAAAVCDLVLLVGETNRAALEAGLREGGARDGAVQWFASREEAFSVLASAQRAGDVILIENDLPDLYEAAVVL